ncbi:hypothetical protein K402DRAFT_467943 [Aulographum hederae CBS 113979]|uniref:dolichol kinase n=1 Tax=Aulographum hederae CBS 113979 TaxID=1176131 RepID=A0A6G1GJI7_9PEZI|nr:hypothetical protein K402DRAFT_467943 [Aulographum hederae CBS 113979]
MPPRAMAIDTDPPDPQESHVGSDEEPSIDGENLRKFSRSPHPYHLLSPSLYNTNNRRTEHLSRDNSSASSPSEQNTPRDDDDNSESYRGPKPRTPSESGTEADDEAYGNGLVKLLPPPPLKPRKGLRDGKDSILDGAVSPLLTPSMLDEDGRRFSQDYFKRRKAGKDSTASTDDEQRAARERFIRRRRAELTRRISEVLLVGAVGLVVVRRPEVWGEALRWRRAELFSHGITVASVFALYPLRLLWYSWWTRGTRSWPRLRVPASFDPAPLIYPTFLPVFCALSLSPSFPKALLPNIVLSLAALPPQLIPRGPDVGGMSALHWFVTLIPLIASENTAWPSKLFPPKPYAMRYLDGLSPETISSLYALHQALLPPLYYLTTTSLLPAELHLLSIALINLLFLSESPQTAILRALLWVGGVLLFVLCGHVLSWGVALARIPRWRLKRACRVIGAQKSFIDALSEGLSRKGSTRTKSPAVDSDADEDLHQVKSEPQALKIDVLSSLKSRMLPSDSAETKSAVEPSMKISLPENNGVLSRRRRNTLPNFGNTSPDLVPSLKTRPRRSKSSVAASFLSLTPFEANLRKYSYAAYVFSVIIAIILLPIRHLISIQALSNHDPFGWAIGYLFGNIQPLRFRIITANLSSFIPLPALRTLHMGTMTALPGGILPRARLQDLGAANTRLLICGYCLLILAAGLLTVTHLSAAVEVDTRRKVFHGMMVAMLLPTIPIDPCFIALALSLVLALFLLLDLVRASQLPPLSKPIAYFLTPYVDGRDLRGPVVVSHIFLLVGCAIPLWLSLAATKRAGESPWVGWDVETRDASMLAGVVCVGMGDAAASLVGRRFGRRKWPWAGGKSLEGSAAFAGAVVVGLVAAKAWLWGGGWEGGVGEGGGLNLGPRNAGDGVVRWRLLDPGALAWRVGDVMGRAAVAATGASFMEAVLTGGNDNVVVPVVLWLLVRGVGL